jgi:phosphatidylinositol-4,5-bisphosphate 3-kinase
MVKEASVMINSSSRDAVYEWDSERFFFSNPLYQDISRGRNVLDGGMRLKDFLASMPSFSDFTEKQLLSLEKKAVIQTFPADTIIFRQGEEGEFFYVIYQGKVDVLIQENISLLEQDDFGEVVTRLGLGYFFGERALMATERRAATIQTKAETVCLVFSRSTYEEIISGTNAFFGSDARDDTDWSSDAETKSLCRHIEKVRDISASESSPKIKRMLYELSTAFTPELSIEEVTARMVMSVKSALRADRVGLFLVSDDGKSLILKVSERGKGIKLPIRGLAGAVVETKSVVNVTDAYEDERFDDTMDRRTGYRTRQVVGVPLYHPSTSKTVGILQVNNRVDGGSGPFSREQVKILELAALQLSELMLGRKDVLINSGTIGTGRAGSVMDDSSSVVNSCDIASGFDIYLEKLNIPIEINTDEISRGWVEIQISVYLGLTQLGSARSAVIKFPKNAKFDNKGEVLIEVRETLSFDLKVRDIPRAARIFFRVLSKKSSNAQQVTAIGWAGSPIFDFQGYASGHLDVKLFSGDMLSPLQLTMSNDEVVRACRLSGVVVPEGGSSKIRIVHNLPIRSCPLQVQEAVFSVEETRELDRILQLSYNPMSLNIFDENDKNFLWNLRFRIVFRPELLPAFVMAVTWSDTDKVQTMYDLLDIWTIPMPTQALQLLDRRFIDPKVRAFAVHCLEILKDNDLSLYMLQLCQQLKFETHVDSALSRFLLRRALYNQRLIGHIFFWTLHSELYNNDCKKRFTILLQIYLQNCGKHRIELGQQMFVMKRFEKVAERVCEGDSKAARLEILKVQLREIILPDEFQLPLSPHIKVSGINVDKCRVMESKKKPLWLTLINADPSGSEYVVMLKVGDDLRQDALILQLLRVMNDIWSKEGLDMQMQVYDCISTGFERGLLQVVLNATTLGSILLHAQDANKDKQSKWGRKIGAAMKALGDFKVLRKWLENEVIKDIRDDSKREKELDRRVNNFIFSSAAYCVASYVLGLGDRHNDNLMITKTGHFFHIDFGHILGNFKYKMGIKRERAPVVFTPAMKEIMSPDQYEAFVELCCEIYNILRANSTLLVSLFSLAIPCNLPELQEERDVLWIYDKLLVGASDEDAAKHFKEVLLFSLKTRGTRINDAAHMIKHG